MSNHPIVHIEFSAENRESTGEFYANLFGWEVQQIPEMNYATFGSQEGLGGGFNPYSESAPAGTTVVYIGTDDIPSTLQEIEKAGGKALVPKTEIPGMGWFAFFEDISGNRVGLYTEMPHQ